MSLCLGLFLNQPQTISHQEASVARRLLAEGHPTVSHSDLSAATPAVTHRLIKQPSILHAELRLQVLFTSVCKLQLSLRRHADIFTVCLSVWIWAQCPWRVSVWKSCLFVAFSSFSSCDSDLQWSPFIFRLRPRYQPKLKPVLFCTFSNQ